MRVKEESDMRVGVYSHFGEESIYGFGQDDTQTFTPYAGVINLHDPSGKPVNNARITLVNKSTMEPYTDARTDANGAARLATQLPAGVTKLAYRIDDSPAVPQAILIDVPAGQGETPQVVTLAGGKGLPIAAVVGGVAILGLLGWAFFKK